MFKLILFLSFFIGFAALVNLEESNERTEQERYAAQRIESQDAILTVLQAMNDATVSEFSSDWRKAYPQPSPADLSELREIEQRIKNDKTVAVKMTRAYKMKNDPLCNGQVKGVFSPSTPDCLPGL